jgi:hypothetical protein
MRSLLRFKQLALVMPLNIHNLIFSFSCQDLNLRGKNSTPESLIPFSADNRIAGKLFRAGASRLKN